MKVIDLLNKRKNNEKMPKKIRFKGGLYEFDEIQKDYVDIDQEYLFCNQFMIGKILNDEVEIINDEKWKTIEDFPNYEISTKGNVRTKEYCDGRNHIRKSKLLNKQINNFGYEYVILSNKTIKHKTLTIHRLMARTFLDDYFDNLDVNHINGIKTDNRIENLEMTTHSENVKKRYEIGNDGNNYKAVKQYDLDGNYIATYKSSYEAEKITGIGRTFIGGCCRKEHHTAGGYVWEFAEEDKEIEKLERINGSYLVDLRSDNSIEEQSEAITNLIIYLNNNVDKINELVKAVNELKKGKYGNRRIF